MIVGSKLVGPSGPTDARIMVVGEAPGKDEEREGEPFVGVSGRLLKESMLTAGINTDEVFFTNLCKVRPPNNELRSFFDAAGLPNQVVLEGLKALHEEIKLVQPNIIIPVGNYPLKFLTGKGKWQKPKSGDPGGYTGIGNYRGYLLEGTAFTTGIKCLPSWHPAAAVRKYPLKHILRADLSKALRHAGSAQMERPRKAILVDPTGPDREAWASWLVSPPGTLSPPATASRWDSASCRYVGGESNNETFRVESGPFLSSDIEYIGSKLLCVGFTRHSDVSVVFTTPNKAAIGFVRDILLCGIPLCFQNGMFDCSILEWHYEIECTKFLKHDTMIGMHASYLELPKDLGFIGSLFTDAPPWHQHIDDAFWKAMREGHGDPDAIPPYNACDVWVTHEGMESLLKDELNDPLYRKSYDLEMALIPVLWDISKRGVKMDIAGIEALKGKLNHEILALTYGVEKKFGVSDFNAKSGKDVANLLFNQLKLPAGPKTRPSSRFPEGQWKLDDSTIVSFLLHCRNDEQKLGLTMLREIRQRRDKISKFCNVSIDSDGRLRCHYNIGPVTGRLSSKEFYPTGTGTNLQNQYRDTDVRSKFVADSGYLFGYADLKSAESYVVAHITGDKEMLRLHSPEFMKGEIDGHRYVASFLLDKPMDRLTKDERYLGKKCRHAGNYGLSWAKLQKLINDEAPETGVVVDAAQAKRLIWKYRQLHPGLQAWWNDVQASLWSTHSLVSLHGRKRVFYDRPDAILPEAIAYVPQSTIADTLNMGLLKVAASARLWELGFEVLLQVHDAIGFQVPERNADEALSLLPALLDIPITIGRRGVEPYDIHIPVEIQTGYNWGEYDPKKPLENPNGLRSWKPLHAAA